MTEQEAEALEMRLTRVWEPMEDPSVSFDHEGGLILRCWLAPNLSFTFGEEFGGQPTLFVITRSQGKTVTGCLIYHDGKMREHDYIPIEQPGTEEQFAEFTTSRFPFFRRNCWLSGCDIEASAHEKAEWTQGFSREEVEAWNLKL